MKEYILKELFKGVGHYFIIETEDPNSKDRKLVFIVLPKKIESLLFERTIETITYKEVKEIEETLVDTNIFLFPKYPPFQTGQRLFMYIKDIMIIKDFSREFLTDLLNSDFKRVWEVKEYLKTQNKQEENDN